MVRRGNQILRRNYRILQGVKSRGESFQIPESELRAMGFDFHWYTRLMCGEHGREAYQVYDLICYRRDVGTFGIRSGPLAGVMGSLPEKELE